MKSNIFNLVAALGGSTLLRVSQAKKLMCSVAAVSGLLWLSAVGTPASAAPGILSISGGTSGTLGANFPFTGWIPANNFGITTGTAVQIFDTHSSAVFSFRRKTQG